MGSRKLTVAITITVILLVASASFAVWLFLRRRSNHQRDKTFAHVPSSSSCSSSNSSVFGRHDTARLSDISLQELESGKSVASPPPRSAVKSEFQYTRPTPITHEPSHHQPEDGFSDMISRFPPTRPSPATTTGPQPIRKSFASTSYSRPSTSSKQNLKRTPSLASKYSSRTHSHSVLSLTLADPLPCPNLPFYSAKCVTQYEPCETDEVGLEPGDIIKVMKVFEDGWGWGINTRSNKRGVFPVVCLGNDN
ncbi:hypothetical protein DFS34DRAFT_435220 [Phlyctochytrium arcticum]|nr:hypothetical protein DFS34DRAFT_435220 [Phlyctochytrium arcticum]